MSVAPLLVSLVVSPLTDWLKQAKWFPWVNPEDASKVHALVVLLSAVGTVLSARFDGTLSQDTVSTLLNALVAVLTSYSGSVAFHELVKRLPWTPPTTTS